MEQTTEEEEEVPEAIILAEESAYNQGGWDAA